MKVRIMKRKEPKQVPRRLLYPTGEACILLCCSVNFLKDEINAGKLGFTIRNNRRLIPLAAIEKYIANQTQGGTEA